MTRIARRSTRSAARDALDALVRSLARDLDRPTHLLLRAELEALTERTVSPRFTAKEIR